MMGTLVDGARLDLAIGGPSWVEVLSPHRFALLRTLSTATTRLLWQTEPQILAARAPLILTEAKANPESPARPMDRGIRWLSLGGIQDSGIDVERQLVGGAQMVLEHETFRAGTPKSEHDFAMLSRKATNIRSEMPSIRKNSGRSQHLGSARRTNE